MDTRMNTTDIERIATAVHKLTHDADQAAHDAHDAEHQFVRLLMAERAESKARWEKVRHSTIGWLVVGFLSFVGAVGYSLVKLVANHLPEFMRDLIR